MLKLSSLACGILTCGAFICGTSFQPPAATAQLQRPEEVVKQQAPKKNCDDAITDIIEKKMAELGVPGVSALVDVPGICHFEKTFGVSDSQKRQPVLRSDHFRVGSVTKTFTGTAVLQLVDEGAFELDDPISLYLPVPNGENITIRQLLQMTSGLYNYSDDLDFNKSLDLNPQRVWTIPELLDIAFSPDHHPYFEPGTDFHYSNTNSILLGLLVEKVTGQPLGQYFQQKIFQPLKMNHTSFPALQDSSIPMPHPSGYMFGSNVGTLPGSCDAEKVGRHDVTEASPSWTWAAGGAISTLKDLAVWAKALAKGTLLTKETQAERLKWFPPGPVPPPRYGLHITDFAGIIGHDGALPGFQSFVGYLPAKDATIVVLTNLYPDRRCGGPADEIVKAIAAELKLLGPVP